VATGAIHHVDITASDLVGSTDFYARILPHMGFGRLADTAEGHPIWAGASCEIGLVPAWTPRTHDRYTPGLHHLAFSAPDRAAVDALHAYLVKAGLPVLDAPALYERYAPGYYAVFFADPDRIKLEYVFTPAWPA
jgi:catechol 2,3-dioxygenase-like lactoylglutathione lyase family enzyme